MQLLFSGVRIFLPSLYPDASRVHRDFFGSLVPLEKMQRLFSGVRISLSFLYPDARRVAPISACVSSRPSAITKRYHKTLPLMGATRLAPGFFQQPRSSGKDAAIV